MHNAHKQKEYACTIISECPAALHHHEQVIGLSHPAQNRTRRAQKESAKTVTLIESALVMAARGNQNNHHPVFALLPAHEI